MPEKGNRVGYENPITRELLMVYPNLTRGLLVCQCAAQKHGAGKVLPLTTASVASQANIADTTCLEKYSRSAHT
jgi:hypothetical protein